MRRCSPLLLSFVLSLGCSKAAVEGPPAEQPEAPAPITPAAPVMHRLTALEYRNTVHDLFGADVVVAGALEPDLAQNGLIAIGASLATVSPWGVEQYEAAAQAIAEQAVAPERRARVLPCATADDACARQSIAVLGRKIWRRPLESDELDRLAALASRARGVLGDFHAGLAYAISAMLQSPSFLFRAEEGTPDPARPGFRRYTGFEMASRLSYLFWTSTPDDALLDAAERGELDSEEGVRAEAARLLDSPRAKDGMRAFFSQMWLLYKLDAMVKDPKIFTHFSTELGPAAREETLRGMERIVFDLDADYREIFLADTTFVDRRLASIYNVPASTREGFASVALPASGGRRGLLGQVSFLALNAHPVSSSATLRGAFVRRVLLCDTVPPPPVDVNTALPEPSGTTRTLRERVGEHLTNPFCAGCHTRMDTIGLGLERFDGIGRWRTKDNGEVIDPSGDVDGVTFSDAWQLAQVVHDHPGTGACLVRTLYRYANGRVEEDGEQETIAQLSRRFEKSGFRVRALLLEIAASPGFRTAKEPER